MEKAMHGLAVEAAKHMLKHIHHYLPQDFETLGIAPEDFAMLAQDKPWVAGERHRVLTTFNALIHGGMDIMGLGRINVPADFQAVVIATCVHPAHHMRLCIWLQNAKHISVRALARSAMSIESQGTLDPVTADQLFDLVMLLGEESETSEAKKRYLAKMMKSINRAPKDSTSRVPV